MRTETRIGVVTGLAVVVAASVYFWRTKAEERDVIVALTPRPTVGEIGPAVTIPKPQQPAVPVARNVAQPTGVASASDPKASRGSIIDPLVPLIPLRTGPSDMLRDAAAPSDGSAPHPGVGTGASPEPLPRPGPPSATTPIGPPPQQPQQQPPIAPMAGGVKVPASAPPEVTEPVSDPLPSEWPKYHLVASGETLAAIARKTYSDARRTDLILAANPEVKDPRQLRIGMKLTLPSPLPPAASPIVEEPRPTTLMARTQSPPAATGDATPTSTEHAPVDSKTRTYNVQPGDSFYSIAESTLGNGTRWKELLELNKKLVGNDPKRLRVGMTLALPAK